MKKPSKGDAHLIGGVQKNRNNYYDMIYMTDKKNYVQFVALVGIMEIIIFSKMMMSSISRQKEDYHKCS